MPDRALLIGINDYPYVNQLRGCLNDVEEMAALLRDTFEFPAGSIRTVTDAEATKDRILTEVRDWLFNDARSGDRLWFHFSGHGSQVDDENDPTGKDELLCLYDIDVDRMAPETYLTDKELGRLFSEVPQGAQLVAVFDSCHSGSGTRELSDTAARALGYTGKVRPLVLVTSPALSSEFARHLVGGETGQQQALSEQPIARYVPPHARVLTAIRTKRQTGRSYASFADRVMSAMQPRRRAGPSEGLSQPRQLVAAPLDYLFYAACRSDQTAADATIGGTPHGAFTYYLTRELSSLGAGGDRSNLDRSVETDLVPYSQLPQFESRLLTGPFFIATGATGPGGGGDPGNPATLPAGGRFDPGTFPTEALRSLGLALGQLVAWAQQGAPGREAGFGIGPRRDVSGKVLVTVHGIGNHPQGYSNGWWDALGSFVPSLQPGDLGGKRQEVWWSNIVNGRGLAQTRDVGRAMEVSEQIKEILRDRAHRDLDNALPQTSSRRSGDRLVDPKAAQIDRARSVRDLSIPNIGGIDDFVNYLINASIRQQVLDRFYGVVQPLLQSGHDIELISHSWGTVVAYEGLLNLEQAGGITGRVRNFFTVGAALSIFAVKPLLIDAARTGRRPSMVRNWVNLNARFDVIGGNLQGNPYQVDSEFLNLAPFGCSPWLPNPRCSHSSYFKTGNVAVNRDIFGADIER